MYQQFSKETRTELAGFRRTGDSITECAKKLGVNYYAGRVLLLMKSIKLRRTETHIATFTTGAVSRMTENAHLATSTKTI